MRSLAWVPTQCDWYSSCNKRKFRHEHMQREDCEEIITDRMGYIKGNQDTNDV